jgi:predicted Zn-dependent protease
MALAIVGISLFIYFSRSERNTITGETQQVALSQDQEIALGLQAAPEMAAMFGGLVQDAPTQQFVDDACLRIIRNSAAGQTDWPFECHVLADGETINAFALPGGQVFLTAGLYNALQTEGQLAGVLAHEIGHVVGRHSAEQLAEQQLAQGLTGAAVIAATNPDNPNSGATAGQVSAMVATLVTLQFGRDDELESDQLGVRFMSEAGYDPRAMIELMRILAESSPSAEPPEFFSTHPNHGNRIAHIQEAIAEQFPNGVPDNLQP